MEATSDPVSLINAIHKRKMKAGVAISPDTPSSVITDEIAGAADMLLVMTVHPGQGGQKFMESCLPKVEELRARFPQMDIEVDGGVGPKTIDSCAHAGQCVISTLQSILKISQAVMLSSLDLQFSGQAIQKES